MTRRTYPWIFYLLLTFFICLAACAANLWADHILLMYWIHLYSTKVYITFGVSWHELMTHFWFFFFKLPLSIIHPFLYSSKQQLLIKYVQLLDWQAIWWWRLCPYMILQPGSVNDKSKTYNLMETATSLSTQTKNKTQCFCWYPLLI